MSVLSHPDDLEPTLHALVTLRSELQRTAQEVVLGLAPFDGSQCSMRLRPSGLRNERDTRMPPAQSAPLRVEGFAGAIQASVKRGDHALATVGLLGLINECHALRETADARLHSGLLPLIERVDSVLAHIVARYGLHPRRHGAHRAAMRQKNPARESDAPNAKRRPGGFARATPVDVAACSPPPMSARTAGAVPPRWLICCATQLGVLACR